MDNYNLLSQASQLAESGQFDRARQLVIQAIKNDRQDAEAWWALAQVAQDDSERSRAVREVLRIDPNHLHALHMRDQIKAGSLDSLEHGGKIGHQPPRTDIDFMPKVAITLVAYFVMYFIGIVLNLYFIHDARQFEQSNGYKPQNTGCLWAMLAVFLVAPVGLCSVAIGFGMIASMIG